MNLRTLVAPLGFATILTLWPSAAQADTSTWYEVGGQITGIDQQAFPFRSPYAGPNSFQSSYQNAATHTYTLFLGIRPLNDLEFYLNPEMARGYGLGGAVGLAGFTNGDVIRQGGFNLSEAPYLARAFIRYDLPLGSGRVSVPAGENVIPGEKAASCLRLTAGKLGTNDLFDVNGYANSTRVQFANWAFITDPAYDYAADTRGYSIGAALEWIHPTWTLRAGSFMMPALANGPDLDPDLANARGDQVELETQARLGPAEPATVRLLGYMNHAHMGNYAQSVATAPPWQAPDITKTERVGAIKYGAALNVEQPLADGGNTGVWARLGWDDGQTESFAYTEADQAFSVGAQVSGARWSRGGDRLGLALGVNGLAASHIAYLKAGGIGFMLGDGQLNYGPETIVEAFYAWQLPWNLTLSPDVQWIANPGYNLDRGPATVLGVRLHAEI
jgi:hypothetical protein